MFVCGRIGHRAKLLLHGKKSVARIMIKFAVTIYMFKNQRE
ncbi:hypothetical protein HMPREF9441_02749 [Paraprevotella clara YIT 11840]|uniref:Uncharacterized protein n=1 Tax=Paraprevotella clara YIT 11840 TaxID=762968 RepID=G5STP4_9BACT|nr:hypothetical protein HMPREF9441_02749 [Paraprevotella clara YIT 11840]